MVACVNKNMKVRMKNDYNCESRDMLIFDEACCHRSSKILHVERYPLRFLFKKDVT